MMSCPNGTKRYTLVLPTELFNDIKKIADARHTSIAGILRRFVKLGLLIIQLEEQSDATLIIREGESEKEVLFL